MTKIVPAVYSAVLAVGLALSVAGPAGAAGNEGDPLMITGSADKGRSVAITDDARALARELGVTPKEAAARFDGQEAFLAAAEKAIAAAPERYFTSTWEPGTHEGAAYRASISFAGPADESIVEFFENLPYRTLVRFDAPASNADIEKVRAEAMEKIWSSGDYDGLTGDINPETGAIEIQVEVASGGELLTATAAPAATMAAVEEIVADVEATSPVDIVVSPAVGIAPLEQTLFGGVAAGGCTLGFTASNSTYRGALSAAHCSNTSVTPARSTSPIYFVKEHLGSYGDAQFWRSSDTVRNLLNTDANGGSRSITSRVDTSTNGISVCNYGKTRTNYACTTVRNWNHAFYNSQGIYLSRMAQTNGTFTNPGDSGGPWFYNNGAYGIHFGKSGGYSTYSRIFDVEAILSVTVLTS
ncbi:hypothetical protein [Georgenia yuyongxinii]